MAGLDTKNLFDDQIQQENIDNEQLLNKVEAVDILCILGMVFCWCFLYLQEKKYNYTKENAK